MWDLKSVSFPGRLGADGETFRFLADRQVGQADEGPVDQFRWIRG